MDTGHGSVLDVSSESPCVTLTLIGSQCHHAARTFNLWFEDNFAWAGVGTLFDAIYVLYKSIKEG